MKVKLIEELIYSTKEKKYLKSNLECIITNTYPEDIHICSNVGLYVWVPNIVVYCITELCYFLMKFSGNKNPVGLKKKPENKSFLQLFVISRPHFVFPTFYSFLFPCICFQIRDNLEEIVESKKYTAK